MQKFNDSTSKLKVRTDKAEFYKTAGTRRSDQNSRSRRRKNKRSSKNTVYTGEPHALFSLLRGLTIILLLTFGVYYGTTLPFAFPYEKITGFFAPKTTGVTASSDQGDTSSKDNIANTNQPAAVAITETTNDKPAENLTQTPSTTNEVPTDEAPVEPVQTNQEPAVQVASNQEPADLTSNAETENPELSKVETPSETTISETDEIRIAKIDSNQPESTDTTASTTTGTAEPSSDDTTIATTQQFTETPATETIEDSNTDGQYTVKTYKATMFSDISSADATETRVSHGAAVKVLERSGDWVKVEIEDNGKIGYMHITQLSGG